jgi:hypothetical protein
LLSKPNVPNPFAVWDSQHKKTNGIQHQEENRLSQNSVNKKSRPKAAFVKIEAKII